MAEAIVNIGANTGQATAAVENLNNTLNQTGTSTQNANAGTQELTNNLEKQEATIKILDGAINLLGGSIELAAGAAIGLGLASEEDTKNFEAAALGAIAFAEGAKRTLDGVVNLTEGITKFGGVQKIATALTNAFGVALKVAMGPVGIAIAAIGLITTAIVLLKDKFEAVNKVATFFGKIFQSVAEFVGLAATEEEKLLQATADSIPGLEQQLKLSKARNESIDEQIKKERELLQAKRDQFEKGTKEYIAAENELEVFEAKVISDREKREDDARQKAADKRKTDAEKTAADKKKEDDDKLKAEEDYLKMLDDLRKKYEAADAALQVEVSNKVDEILQKRLDAQTQEENAVYDKYFRLQEAAAGNAEAMAILEEGMQAELTTIGEKYSDKRIEDANKEKDAILQSRMALAAGIGDAIGALGALFEQGTAASKTAALAEIAINTAIGFVNALTIAQKTSQAAGPGAAFAFPIFYATQVAAVLGAIGAAKNVLAQTPGGGSGPSISKPGVPGTPSFGGASFTGGLPGTGGAAPTFGSGRQEPIRAYVISQDVTTGQEATAAINRRRRLGPG